MHERLCIQSDMDMHTRAIGCDTGRCGLVHDPLDSVQQFAVIRRYDAEIAQRSAFATTLATEVNGARSITYGNVVGRKTPSTSEDARAGNRADRCGFGGGHFKIKWQQRRRRMQQGRVHNVPVTENT